MVTSVATARLAETSQRLTELRDRMDRLRAGEVPTRADVERARTAARAQQGAARRAYQRLLRTHASAVSHALMAARAGPLPPQSGQRDLDALVEENERLRDALVAIESSSAPARTQWSEDRVRWAWRALVDECSSSQWRGWAHALCVVATRLPSVRGAALTLYDREGIAHPFAASDPWARDVEEFHHIVGEGPALEVSLARPSVVVADIVTSSGRWPGFVDLAVGAGLRGVSAFLVTLGPLLRGSLTLYRTTPAPPEDPSDSDAALLADVAAAVLMADADSLARGGSPAALDEYLDVHVAAGMLSVRLAIGLPEARLWLRARAFGTGRTLIEVAREVIEGASAPSTPPT